MTIDEELQKIPELASIGKALMQFAGSLENGAFVREGKRWVYRPNNFVVFEFRHARVKDIAVTVYGWHNHFEKDQSLGLKSGRSSSYSIFNVANPGQLAAAANYIRRSFELRQVKQRETISHKRKPSIKDAAEELFRSVFSEPRNRRSEEYKAAVRAVFRHHVHGEPIQSLYPMGTAQADAWFAGITEGHGIWREHLNKTAFSPTSGEKYAL